MARPGVSYNDVANAANQVKGQGKNPTIETVRAILGTGSISTINNHLRKWKEINTLSSSVATKDAIPDELISLVKGLWERVVNQSAERVAELESTHHTTVAELELELEKYKTNNQRWQQLYNQWLQEKTKLANDHLLMEKAYQESQNNYATLNAKQETLLQQLQEKQERIDELNRLHKQSQMNLEHYRESVREQRLVEQQQFEQQKQEVNLEVRSLNETIAQLREKYTSTQLAHQSIQQSYSELQKNYADKCELLEDKNKQIVESEKINHENKKASDYWQTQCQELQKVLEQKTAQFIDAQTDTKLLSHQLNEEKVKLTQLDNQNKLLIHDKWIISQEKAQLEGQLKQMQKMLTA